MIRAAGGAVWRDLGSGVEVLLVHRPRFDDWSLPKGKCKAGEDDLSCGLREVLEETGLACTVGEELLTTSYQDRKGHPKTVRYWAMTVEFDDGFAPGDEVDRIRWVRASLAAALLSYAGDIDVVASLLDAIGDCGTSG